MSSTEDVVEPTPAGGDEEVVVVDEEAAVDVVPDDNDNNNGEEEAPPGAANGESGGKGANNKKKKEDLVPIEELYDLSKPIPRVDRPDKTAHEAAVKELTDAIDALKEDRKKIQADIDLAMNDPKAKEALTQARTQLNGLKTQKNALLSEKKALRAQLDTTKTQTDKIIKDKKETRSNLKFNTLEEIEAEMKKLQRQQETTTMSLQDEKRLIKELDALQQSKKFVADLKNKDVAMDSVKEQRKAITTQITAKDKEMDELTKQIDAIMVTIKQHTDADSKKRDSLQGLFKKRDDLKKAVGEKLKDRDALRDDFREKSNVWFNYQRALRAQKKMAYEEEKKKREEERALQLQKFEEEEAKKIPYEEEQALCDYLADYLERTYLTGKTDNSKDDETTGGSNAPVAVLDDPFAGLKPVNKKADDEYFGKGKAKKKRVRSTKKQDQVSAGPFTLSVDTFEQFGLISMIPPTSIEQVEKSVNDLREKKEWYKQQPRGSVPTANEIRKANEKAVAKIKHAEPEKKISKPGAFSLSNDEFAPLGAGATASGGTNASWGQKNPTSLAETAAPAIQEAS